MSTSVTVLSGAVSLVGASEIGLGIELGAMVAPYVYQGYETAIQDASWGITNWTESLENSAASAEYENQN